VDSTKERIISALKARFREVKIFGSQARGDALKHSDIDIIIVDPKFEDTPYPKRVELARGAISRILEETPIDVDIIPLTPEEFQRLKRQRTNIIGIAYKRGEVIEA